MYSLILIFILFINFNVIPRNFSRSRRSSKDFREDSKPESVNRFRRAGWRKTSEILMIFRGLGYPLDFRICHAQVPGPALVTRQSAALIHSSMFETKPRTVTWTPSGQGYAESSSRSWVFEPQTTTICVSRAVGIQFALSRIANLICISTLLPCEVLLVEKIVNASK